MSRNSTTQHRSPAVLATSAALALLAALAACADAPTAMPSASSTAAGGRPSLVAAQATTNETDLPVQFPIQIPCSRLGREIVVLSGTEHTSLQQQSTAAGATHVRVHVNARGVTGVGLVTGDSYQSAGTTQESFDFDVAGFPASYDLTYNFTLTSPGATGNIVAHEVLRVSYDALGNSSVDVVHFDATCR